MSETPATPEPTPAPASPAAASTPPAAPAAPAVKSSEEYFNSSRLKIIGMITAATLAVGALGGIAGVAFDPEAVSNDNVIQPGGDGGKVSQQGAGSGGNSSPRGKASALTLAIPGADATQSPSSVGSASPGSGGFSESPTGAPTEGTDSPSPSEGGSVDGGGQTATITATGVDVYVPPAWHVDFTDDDRVLQSNDQNSFSLAFSYADDASTSAGDVITQNLDSLLPAENYTQLQTSDIVPLDPFGSVVSLAAIEYDALWADNQGSISIHGQIYVGVRQDGTVLGILVEHAPAQDFESSFDDLAPILNGTFSPFGGLTSGVASEANTPPGAAIGSAGGGQGVERPGGAAGRGGQVVTLNGGTQVPVPPGWSAVGQEDDHVTLVNPQNDAQIYVEVEGGLMNDTTAQDSIDLEGLLPTNEYCVEDDNYFDWDGPGSISTAGYNYRALLLQLDYGDPLGCVHAAQAAGVPVVRVYGEIHAAVRPGSWNATYLLYKQEVTPPERFDEVFGDRSDLNATFASFAGVS